ncbi:MAG: NAD(P)/FAD-dependent oxidoreductase, partial [Streptosporangiaceae bacterium]
MRADLVVIGAGPAGMAASLAAADLGCEVTLLDGASRVGGQIYRQSDLPPPGRQAAPQVGGRLPQRFHRLVDHPRVRWVPESTVWLAERRDGRAFLHATVASGQLTLDASVVVVAAGATEIALPFPGWELPGVTTAGAAQALLKAQSLPVGTRVLVAGSGPFLLPVAADLADAGATVVSVLEATRAAAGARHGPDLLLHPAKLGEAAGYAARLARRGVPVRPGSAVVACHGRDTVERATIARVDPAWRPVPGSRRGVDVDAVCVTHGFAPALELPRALGCAERRHRAKPVAAVWHDRDQATSVPGVFAAGETTGVGGAQVAELEGTIAGHAAARHLGRPSAGPPRAVRRRLAAARRFAGIIDRLYP